MGMTTGGGKWADEKGVKGKKKNARFSLTRSMPTTMDEGQHTVNSAILTQIVGTNANENRWLQLKLEPWSSPPNSNRALGTSPSDLRRIKRSPGEQAGMLIV